MTGTPTYYAGIDAAKDRLDVVLRPSGGYVGATNDEAGIRSVVRRLRKGDVALWRYSKLPGGSSSPPPRPSSKMAVAALATWRRSGATSVRGVAPGITAGARSCASPWPGCGR